MNRLYVVSLEVWPEGDKNQAVILGRVEIVDACKHADEPEGDYLYAVEERGKKTLTGRVLAHPRRLGGWWIAFQVLQNALWR